MNNILTLFKNDVRRICTNVVTGIIVLGLVFLPSIFSWYNIIACWDVFDNTGNLKVAVANSDEGYDSDLVPLPVNMGEQVVSALRANDQMAWTFVSEEEAKRGVESGEFYAAVVIPPSFSRDMMTFYSDDVQHAQLVYYINEKKNVVAPKITDQGASKVSYQVNQVFAETLSGIALSTASSLYKYTDSASADSRVGDLANHVATMGAQLDQAAGVVSAYSGVLESSQKLIAGSSDLLAQAKGQAAEAGAAVAEEKAAVDSIAGAMKESSSALASALEKSAAGYEGVAESVDQAFASTDTLSGTTVQQLRAQAAAAGNLIPQYQALVDQLEALKGSVEDEATKQYLDSIIGQLNSIIALQENLRDSLNRAADAIEQGNATAQSQHAEVKAIAAELNKSFSELSVSYNEELKPQLDALAETTGALTSSLSASAQKLADVGSALGGAADSVSGQLESAQENMAATAGALSASGAKLTDLSAAMNQALANNDATELRKILSSDTTALAAALSAPVQLERHAVFPAENFGSQMAPLYTTLAIWIGSLLLVVAVQVMVSKKARAQLNNPKMHQLFLGRFGVFSLLSFLQTTVLALGNMFFLKIQVSDAFLYLLCFWLAGQVFTFIMYTLVVSFANLGKAAAVFLLIVQVTAGGGSYPLQMLPDFFQWLSPYLPATHVINAMRAAMMGVYQGDFWFEMGALLLFIVPFALLGLALRKPLVKFLKWYIRKVEDSKLVC